MINEDATEGAAIWPRFAADPTNACIAQHDRRSDCRIAGPAGAAPAAQEARSSGVVTPCLALPTVLPFALPPREALQQKKKVS